ncbi:MAG: hypothetical protein Q8L10_03080 [Candidatus Moranbacteria bacterium]|nr:hypothetical protein [Candidatus Moranbacteria bacterium]
MKEKYIPSKEEIELAEEMAVEGQMTPEQKKDSEIRAKNWEQKQMPWISPDFDNDNIDENFERKPVTLEQKEEMDKRLAELAKIFEGLNINWHLDGALNISLMIGRYIGNHKDIDLSIEKSELAEFESQLLKKGFGLFLSRTENKTKNKILRRFAHDSFVDTDTEHEGLLVVAINKGGQVRRDNLLNFVDIHIVGRNADGQPLSGISGVVIPDKWAKPYPVEFQGKQFNLSHPGKILYYKLNQGRGYDVTDIQRLIKTGMIKEEDVTDVEKVIESEFTANVVHGRKVIESVVKQLTPEMNTDQIIDVILQQHESTKGGEEAREFFRPIAQKIFESDDKSTDAMLKTWIELFKVEEKNNQKLEEINRVRQSVVERN